jgi:hypothetical protein
MKRLSDQVASVERRLRDLAKRFDELAEEIHGQRPQSQRPRRSRTA